MGSRYDVVMAGTPTGILVANPRMTVTASSSHGTVVTTELEAPVRRRARARWRSAATLAIALVASATVAALSAALVVFARDVWFDNLQRPAWVPSAWTFLLVATALYAVGTAIEHSQRAKHVEHPQVGVSARPAPGVQRDFPSIG